MKVSLKELALSQRHFIDRHIGPDESEIEQILAELGQNDLNSYISAIIPEKVYDESAFQHKEYDVIPEEG
jgi:glycine cleavage system pyridoxal-binding protein P